MDVEREIQILESLADSLKKTKELGEKQEILLNYAKVAQEVEAGKLDPFLGITTDLTSKIALFSVVAVGQQEILFQCAAEDLPKEKVRHFLAQLVSIERFYESIGGIVGYHAQVLKLLLPRTTGKARASFSRFPGVNLSNLTEEAQQSVWEGILCLDEMAEIYPLGGLGSRLNLLSKSAEALPAASLPYAGRTLLEGLVRDVQAREFLYNRLFNKQITVPIALMASFEKNNHERVRAVCEKQNWFGRPHESFRIFHQISVPVVTEEGKWSMKNFLELNLQPGGHGALWKAAEEGGIFFWLQGQEKSKVLIRQINNPIAGIDIGLLALVGIGKSQKKTFGFASCERLPHAAEGVLVLVEEEDGTKRLSNIEYTDFKRYDIDDQPVEGGYSRYPANTNILYADLDQILPIIKKNPLPGLTLNMKNKEPYLAPNGVKSELIGGRLESMMQNISDALTAPPGEPLPTFLTYNLRRRTISAAKRSFEQGKSLLETPEGSFYDLQFNAHDLLKNVCSMEVDPFCSPEEYLNKGPSHHILYHPALGPLYDLIRQKIQGGRLAMFAELQLEIADLILDQLLLDGSLLIHAKNTLGHNSQGIIRYSQRTGKCFLKNVTVVNKGINRKTTTNYWKNQIKRHQALKIVLQGHSEFYAENVAFHGDKTIVVPNGERWIASQEADGRIRFQVEKAGWKWEYSREREEILFNVPDCTCHRQA